MKIRVIKYWGPGDLAWNPPHPRVKPGGAVRYVVSVHDTPNMSWKISPVPLLVDRLAKSVACLYICLLVTTQERVEIQNRALKPESVS